MTYVGIDVSKTTFVVAYSSAKNSKVATFPNTVKGVALFIKTISPEEHRVVMEATGNYSMLLAYLLDKKGIVFSMENPLKIKNFARTMLMVNKTDVQDARMIAEYGEKMNPAPFNMRSESILILKQKRTVIRQLKKQLVATKNLKGSLAVLPVFDSKCKRTLENTIEFLERQLKKMESELTSVANELYKKQMSLLTSIKVIGATLAAALIITTGGFTYFDNAKQFTRYIGISPNYQQSGTSVNYRGHINRNGDPTLRSNLYIAACSSIRCNSECRECYNRLRASGKPGKVAIVAVANKLIRQAFAVISNDTPYIDGYVSEKTKHKTKCLTT